MLYDNVYYCDCNVTVVMRAIDMDIWQTPVASDYLNVKTFLRSTAYIAAL